MVLSVILGLAALLTGYNVIATASGGISWAGIAFALLFLLLALQTRCPQCRLEVMAASAKQKFMFGWPKPHCPRCGRNRVWVWPFQYLIRPEHRA